MSENIKVPEREHFNRMGRPDLGWIYVLFEQVSAECDRLEEIALQALGAAQLAEKNLKALDLKYKRIREHVTGDNISSLRDIEKNSGRAKPKRRSPSNAHASSS